MASPAAGQVVDTHVHLFPPDVLAHRDRYAERDPFFGFLYSSPRAHMVAPEQLLADMDRDGVAEAIVVGWPWQQHDLCVEHNSWLIEVVKSAPGRPRLIAVAKSASRLAGVPKLRSASSNFATALSASRLVNDEGSTKHPISGVLLSRSSLRF